MMLLISAIMLEVRKHAHGALRLDKIFTNMIFWFSNQLHFIALNQFPVPLRASDLSIL